MTTTEHVRLAVALRPARVLAWAVALMLLGAWLSGCKVTELRDCTLALDEAPPNGRLVCAGRTIPVRRLAPWLWDAVKAHEAKP